jgi:hypothetical protein
MTNQSATFQRPNLLPPRDHSPWAALLSYLVPGLGQICQGRVSKGIFFMVTLYALFLGGMYLDDWKNVYIADTARNNPTLNLPNFLVNIYNRPQYAGQFWIGIAAWPAIWQYNQWPVPSVHTSPFWHYFQQTPPESVGKVPPDWEGGKTLNELQTDGDKTWDLGWVYTVIAGVLNVLVIYDAFAGPAFATPASGLTDPEAVRFRAEGLPV